MKLIYDDVVAADEICASRHDRPRRYGLQALTADEQDRLLGYLGERYEPAKGTDWYRTSEYIARQAERHFRKEHQKMRVTNLMVKSAMHLLGYSPAVEHVDIMHYRIQPRDKEGSP